MTQFSLCALFNVFLISKAQPYPEVKIFKKAELPLRYCVSREDNCCTSAQDRQHAGADFTLICPPTTNSLWCCCSKGNTSSEPKKVPGI